MLLIDSHTHLDSTEFDSDREAVIERARAAGVGAMITIGSSKSFDSAQRAIALAEQYPFIWASAGIHPHAAETPHDRAMLTSLASHPRVVALGETGLDFFRDWAPVDLQRRWFITQIEIARELKKPMIIHSRNAGDECLSTLITHKAAEVGGVFHCYAEDADFAKKLAEINFLVSFPGTITFKNAEQVRETARGIPLSQILVETDAPYMAPHPHRGKRCESAFVVETARMLATVKEVSLDEVARVTTENCCRLFKLPPLTQGA